MCPVDVTTQVVRVEVIQSAPIQVGVSVPGPQGASGPAGTVAVGTVAVIPSGQPATVTNSGTPSNAILNFNFPLAEGSGLPPGGVTGDIIEKQSSTEQDATWGSFLYQGFSNRFNTTLNFTSVRQFLAWLADITYTAPLISLSASGNSLREKGDAVTSTTLTAAITKRSDPIAQVRFYLNPSTLLDTQIAGGAIPNGGNSTFAWTGSFSDNTTFRAEVNDSGATGGPTTVTSTTTFNFVYPYYTGSGAAGLSAAAVAALTKLIINSTANREQGFTTPGGQVLYFAYPASYGALTSILDANNFETIADWTLRTENITGLDTTAVSYRIYEFKNPLVAGTTTYTFIR
jgi:hypothetical protein